MKGIWLNNLSLPNMHSVPKTASSKPSYVPHALEHSPTAFALSTRFPTLSFTSVPTSLNKTSVHSLHFRISPPTPPSLPLPRRCPGLDPLPAPRGRPGPGLQASRAPPLFPKTSGGIRRAGPRAVTFFLRHRFRGSRRHLCRFRAVDSLSPSASPNPSAA